MKQTAVEWFIEQIKKDSNLRLRGFDLDGIGEQAKEMEKQQIIDAYNNCIKDRYNNALVDMGFKEKSEKCYNTGKEYYKEKYEKN